MHASNVVLLQGSLSRDSERRTLPSGEEWAHYEVTTRCPEHGAESVSVVWPGAPSRADLAAGTHIVVAGRVRRRFFRSGGVTASRTEVVAEGIAAAGSRAGARLVARVVEAAGMSAR